MHYGAPGAAAAGFGQLRVTSLAFPAVLERLREAIAAEGLWVLHEIDPQAILAGPVRRSGRRGRSCSSIRTGWCACWRPTRRPCWKRR